MQTGNDRSNVSLGWIRKRYQPLENHVLLDFRPEGLFFIESTCGNRKQTKPVFAKLRDLLIETIGIGFRQQSFASKRANRQDAFWRAFRDKKRASRGFDGHRQAASDEVERQLADLLVVRRLRRLELDEGFIEWATNVRL